MEYKKLGLTDLEVSRIGFGGCPIGGYGWGDIKDDDSIAAIQKALEAGINFFDTADIYGLGHSEEVLAKGLGKHREKVIIATKVGLRWSHKDKKSHRDLTPKHIREAAENSLKRLQINSIPLYQMHYPDPNTPISETMGVLEELKKEGKIRHIGCSNFTAGQIEEAQKYGRVESLQSLYNLLDRDLEEFLVPVCDKFKIGIIAHSPLAQGLLAGKIDSNTKFDENDRRSRKEYKNFHGRRFEANLEIIEKLKDIAAKYDKSPVQVAIKWILDNPSVTAAILGIKKPEEIEENIGCLGLKLLPQDREFLSKTANEVYARYGVRDDNGDDSAFFAAIS